MVLVTKSKWSGGWWDTNDKGYFLTPVDLNTAYPVWQLGRFAIVWSTQTEWTWNGIAWIDTWTKATVTRWTISGSLSSQIDLQNALNAKQSTSEKGQAFWFAWLWADWKVPAWQLPSLAWWQMLNSATDTTLWYLMDKIVAWSNMTITKMNAWGNEYILVSAAVSWAWSIVRWAITGSITNQTDLQSALSALQASSAKWNANWYAWLDASWYIPLANIPPSLIWWLNVVWVWNATTNSPTLTSSVGTKWNVYICNVAWTTTLDWISVWAIWDSAFYDWSVWRKIQWASVTVASVFGRTWNIVAQAGDYNADQITPTATNVFLSPAQKVVVSNTSWINSWDETKAWMATKGMATKGFAIAMSIALG